MDVAAARREPSLPHTSLTGGEIGSDAGLAEWCKDPSSAPAPSSSSSSASMPSIPANFGAMPLIQRHHTLPQGDRADAAAPFFVEAVQYQQLFSMDRSNKYTVRMFPQVDRGFFLTENEWTCYRRNYFQVSCAFSLIGDNGPASEPECPCIVAENESAHPVARFLVGISAQVANSDKKIELVQHTPKRDKGPQNTPQPQPTRASSNMYANTISVSSNSACFERLQFKTATANNGKRRAAQQYYVLIVELFAECDDGSRILVAASASSPIVVRGRSPGHYADGSNRRNTVSSGHTSKMMPSFEQHTVQSQASAIAAMRPTSSITPSVNPGLSGVTATGYGFPADMAHAL
ncbi:hypothetical protein GGI12_002479, partial [Dipsacomyces acuminosporus]